MTEEKEEEIEEGEVGQKKKEATTYHGSLLLQDLHPATRYEFIDLYAFG